MHSKILLTLALYCVSSHSLAVTLGNYTGHEIGPEGLAIQAGDARVVITPYSDPIVRVSLRPNGEDGLDSSSVVVLNPQLFDWTVTGGDSDLTVTGPQFILRVDLYPVRLRWDLGGSELVRDESGFVWAHNIRGLRLVMSPSEHYYGAGERADGLDHRGHRLEGYNAPSYCYGDGSENLNISIPFVLSSQGYGLYFENTYPHALDFGSTSPNVFEYSTTGGELSYFLIGGSALEVLESYTELTGRQPLPPRWSLGYLQSRFGYQSETEARAMVTAFRDQQIPLDALILDLYWFGWGQMGDLDWDRSHWGNPISMMDNFSSVGVKTILITEPYVLESSTNFQTCYDSGFLTPDSSGTPLIIDQFWAGSAGLVDITLSAAEDWLWGFYQDRANEGVSGWWSDLGEPEMHPDNMVHDAGPAALIHNVYSLLWAKLLFEKYEQVFPTQRLFNLIRSGYAGMQRYSTFPWSGDVQRSFSGMRAQLPIMLNMGLSGVSYCGSDLGGFDCGPLDEELYIRWMQMGAFSPTMRAHGVNVPTEPVNFDSATRRIVADYIRLRYRMLPYNYTLAWQNHRTGLPLVRPLFFDEQTWETANLFDEYLWGANLLVAPVTTEGARARDVVLPEGLWVNFWTDVEYPGEQTVQISAPLDQTPVLVRGGSIIPTVPVIQSTEDYNTDTLIVEYYPNPAIPDAEFTMYEDDGHTPSAYTLDQFELVILTGSWNAGSYVMNFQRQNHGFPQAPTHRKIYCNLHRVSSPPAGVFLDGSELPAVNDSALYVQADSAVYWDSELHLLRICFQWRGIESSVEISDLQVLDAAQQDRNVPNRFVLNAAYPNPFNAATAISFELERTSAISLRVYDLSGRLVAVLLDRIAVEGPHKVMFDGSNLSSGIYFARLEAERSSQTKKLVLLK